MDNPLANICDRPIDYFHWERCAFAAWTSSDGRHNSRIIGCNLSPSSECAPPFCWNLGNDYSALCIRGR